MQDSTRFKIPLKSKPVKDKIPFNNKHVSHTVLHVSVANFIISLINFSKNIYFYHLFIRVIVFKFCSGPFAASSR